MRNRFVAAVAALALLSATSPVAARTIYPAYGGPGDAAFDDHCPAHQFLIGLAGHAGLWIDRIQIICSPILPDGTHGTKYYGPLHGGGGGTVVETSCPPDSVVYGAQMSLSELTHQRVSQIELSCGSMQADRQSSVRFGANNSSLVSPLLQRCVNGELGSGFNGHYGKDVNAIGLDCAVRTRS